MSESDGNDFMTNIRNAIDAATQRITSYTTAAESFVTTTGEQTTDLQRLIGVLRRCLERLRGIQSGYNDILRTMNDMESSIQRLEQDVQSRVEAAEDTCRSQLQEIQGLITGIQINDFQGQTDALQREVDDLSTLIDTTCNDADNLIAQLERQQQEIISRRQGNSSGNDGGGNEQKQASFVERQARAMEENNPVEAQQIASRRSASMGVPERQRLAEETAIERQRVARANRRGSERGLPGYDLGGGWQTPEKLESLSRTRPVRTLRVLKKKKKKTKRKTKNKKKKQTKRRRRKRRKKRSRKR